MSNFKQRKIRFRLPRKKVSEKTKQTIITALSVFLLLLLVYYSGLYLIDRLGGTRIIHILSGLFGKELVIDEKNHTNILLLGVGGAGHDGSDLTDTLIIASINHTNESVSLFSLPRDLYIEPSVFQLPYSPGLGGRINEIYALMKKTRADVLERQGIAREEALAQASPEGLSTLRKAIEKTLNIPIHYVVKVDFAAFEKIVDSIGGVEVLVEKGIYDLEYPRGETGGYETFSIAKGMQKLDGKTALKYVRSRKTTSDFDRSKRQQQVLLAMKSKVALQSSSGRKQLLKDLYYSLKNHVETDLTMREMLSLADFGVSWDSSKLTMATLNDNSEMQGGFLYTPDRSYFSGAYVLLPVSRNFDQIQQFAQLILYGPEKRGGLNIAILNGTKRQGLGTKAYSIFTRLGIAVAEVQNARSQKLTETIWYIDSPDAKELVSFLTKILPGRVVSEIPIEYKNNPKLAMVHILLELGEEAKTPLDNLDTWKKLPLLKPVSPPPEIPSALTPKPAPASRTPSPS